MCVELASLKTRTVPVETDRFEWALDRPPLGWSSLGQPCPALDRQTTVFFCFLASHSKILLFHFIGLFFQHAKIWAATPDRSTLDRPCAAFLLFLMLLLLLFLLHLLILLLFLFLFSLFLMFLFLNEVSYSSDSSSSASSFSNPLTALPLDPSALVSETWTKVELANVELAKVGLAKEQPVEVQPARVETGQSRARPSDILVCWQGVQQHLRSTETRTKRLRRSQRKQGRDLLHANS